MKRYKYLIYYKEYGSRFTWVERDFINIGFELKTQKDIERLENKLQIENNPEHTFEVLSIYPLESSVEE
jgi:hypothetical protein